MRKINLIVVICSFLSLTVSAQQARTPVRASNALSQNTTLPVTNLVSCDGVLGNYTNSDLDPAGGVSSQNFEISIDTYDNMAADDFIAPGSGESNICQVAISGTFSAVGFAGDPASQIELMVFEDDGGLPGVSIYSEVFSSDVDDDNDGSFVLDLTGSPTLMGGTTYWLGVRAALDFSVAGQWYWDTAQDGNGNPYAWQNPGDGFASGCVDWTTHSSCALPGSADLIMDIGFNDVLGINSNSLEAAVRIFPNPVNGQFTIQSDISLKNLKIFDISGRIVGSIDLTGITNEKTIDVSSLVGGIYMVEINGERGSLVKRFVKK